MTSPHRIRSRSGSVGATMAAAEMGGDVRGWRGASIHLPEVEEEQPMTGVPVYVARRFLRMGETRPQTALVAVGGCVVRAVGPLDEVSATVGPGRVVDDAFAARGGPGSAATIARAIGHALGSHGMAA